MPTSKNDVKDPMRELETIVRESFEAEMLASGFVRGGRGWKRWLAAVAGMIKANMESKCSAAEIESRGENIRRRVLYCTYVETRMRAQLDASLKIWTNNLNYTQSMVRDSVRRVPPGTKEAMLKEVKSMREKYGATSVLEELLVEWAILARLEHQRLAAFAELFKEELAPPNKLIRQVRSAELRTQRAARMCAAARQLRNTERERTEQEHCECPSATAATPVIDSVPSDSSIKDLPLS